MEGLNLSTDRVNDLYISANRSFRAQSSLENPDYSEVIADSERVVELKDRAIKVKDAISAFNETLQQSDQSLNLEGVRNSYNAAVSDLEAERYSEAENHLDEARSRLSTAKSSLNQAQAFYDATTNDLMQYIRNNTKLVVTGSSGFLLFVLIGFNEMRYLRISGRVTHLERKEEVVEDLMKDAEKKYYVERNLDEQTFEARQRKYGEILNHAEEKLPVYRKKMQNKKSVIKSLKALTGF